MITPAECLSLDLRAIQEALAQAVVTSDGWDYAFTGYELRQLADAWDALDRLRTSLAPAHRMGTGEREPWPLCPIEPPTLLLAVLAPPVDGGGA